ncbi:hypothetical protein KZP23_17210 [Echinicola marina]|uniref:hypothetical protein n=1 Tax=Echinicola marina TaxID=2859768 RepID=UPI001CF633D6|nr:hypothetical protein [Echinicola marina]UCS92421.1 hypothetical protein KZP23_17210 [Echinicola marina]
MKAILNIPMGQNPLMATVHVLIKLPKSIAGTLNAWDKQQSPKIRIAVWIMLLGIWSATILYQAYQGSKNETMAMTMDKGPDEFWALTDSLSNNSKTKKHENDQH